MVTIEISPAYVSINHALRCSGCVFFVSNHSATCTFSQYTFLFHLGSALRNAVVVEADAAADSVADAHRLSATTAKKKATSPGSALKVRAGG